MIRKRPGADYEQLPVNRCQCMVALYERGGERLTTA